MISIIIPTYNETEQIAKTIDSIYDLKDATEIEIFVINAGSTDETIATAKDYGAVSYLREKREGLRHFCQG